MPATKMASATQNSRAAVFFGSGLRRGSRSFSRSGFRLSRCAALERQDTRIGSVFGRGTQALHGLKLVRGLVATNFLSLLYACRDTFEQTMTFHAINLRAVAVWI